MRRMYVGGEFYRAVTQGEKGRGEGFDLILPDFDQFFLLYREGLLRGRFLHDVSCSPDFFPLKALGTQPLVDFY